MRRPRGRLLADRAHHRRALRRAATPTACVRSASATSTTALLLASETCALEQLGATFVREVEPGEIVRIDANGLTSTMGAEPQRRALCMLEYIYFARPDSRMRGELLYEARMRMGAELSHEHPVEADIVIGIPDSATAAAIGYAQASGIPYVEALVKNRYVGRTFIQPDRACARAACR